MPVNSNNLSEFDIIAQFFTRSYNRPDVILGVGDDAAIVAPKAGQQLVITTDTLISGVHFPSHTQAIDIGYKALAVNLSDIAAMGATPLYATLALTMPNSDRAWIQNFATGFFELAEQSQTALLGGDLTCGPLTITIQLIGSVPPLQAITRGGAKAGDRIFVTGQLGAAGLGLQIAQQQCALTNLQATTEVLNALNRPTPRLAVGTALRGIAHSMCDISDGLCQDLSHILERSYVGAKLWLDKIPIHPVVRTEISAIAALKLALTAGDDYELCFTAPKSAQPKLKEIALATNCPITEIGIIVKDQGLQTDGTDSEALKNLMASGYQHF